MHRLHCQNPWFTFIRNGQKTVEGRKNLPKYRSWQPGDKLVFVFEDDSFETRIVALRSYETLEEYLTHEGFDRVLPGVKSFEDAMRTYLQWSTRQEIAQYGFLAIEISILID